MKNRIGFMQGRLLSDNTNKIQNFPDINWKNEIYIASLLGYKIMEWTINKSNIKKNPLFNGKTNELNTLLRKLKIKINSITCDYLMEDSFFKKKNKNKKRLILNNINKIIKNSQKCGVKFIVLPLVDGSSLKNRIEEKILIQEIVNLLKKNKKIIILFESDYRPVKLLKFIECFNSNRVGINYDTGNSASLNYNMKDEMIYFDHVKNIHIKDRLKFGNTTKLGTGSWNYKKFSKLLKKTKYKGNFILQTARSNKNNDIEELQKNKEFLLKVL